MGEAVRFAVFTRGWKPKALLSRTRCHYYCSYGMSNSTIQVLDRKSSIPSFRTIYKPKRSFGLYTKGKNRQESPLRGRRLQPVRLGRVA